MNSSQRGSMQFYLAAIILALVAIALGIWEAMVDREGGDWLIQLILPALLVIVLAGMHSQARRNRIAREMAADEQDEEESEDEEGQGYTTDRSES